jgi:hypothetical protein
VDVTAGVTYDGALADLVLNQPGHRRIGKRVVVEAAGGPIAERGPADVGEHDHAVVEEGFGQEVVELERLRLRRRRHRRAEHEQQGEQADGSSHDVPPRSMISWGPVTAPATQRPSALQTQSPGRRSHTDEALLAA